MADLDPTVERVDGADGMVELWSPRTGRGATLSDDALRNLGRLPAVQRRLERLGMLADSALASFIPCRHHRTLLVLDPPTLMLPCPDRHGPGGYAYRAQPLSERDLALWRALDGRTLAAIADDRGLSVAATLERLRPWLARDTQAVQLRDERPRPNDHGLRHLVGPPRAAHRRTADQRDASGGTTLATYHHTLGDVSHHFDDRETTVAHALALPHPGLAGRRYGAAVRRAVSHDGPVVEVGCGTGELAAAWLAEGAVDYLRIDLSPALLAHQAAVAPQSRGLLGDATALPLPDRSVPFLLSNEVLADLRAAPAHDPEVQALREQYRLPERPLTNTGSIRFIEQVARVLSPGGRAALTEFGSPDADPEEATQLDHPEVSINFADLLAVARRLGLQAELRRVDDWLGVDLAAPQLSRPSWLALRAAAAARGERLEARAWTPANLRLPFRVEGLHWTTLADEGPGPLITRFYALLLRR